MLDDIFATVKLNNGVQMPWLGLGVYKNTDNLVLRQTIEDAIVLGYRSIDTAMLYGNEEIVGEGVKFSGIPREQFFLTTKVWNDDQGYESTLKAFELSRKKLNVDYIDLYLIHWAVKEKYLETWRALEKLYRDGYVRAIGMSNFQIHHLEDLMAKFEVIPAINQVEYHPRLSQLPLRRFLKEKGIQMEAWSPLMRGKLIDHPTLIKIGEKYNKTASQVILRWDLQTDVITIPKTVKRERLIENSAIFDFELSAEDMRLIGELNTNERAGADPDNFDFSSK